MSLATGFILMCAIVSFGCVALVGFVVWLCRRDMKKEGTWK